jgi:hypothetical protein
MDSQSAYRFDPSQWPRRRELEQLREERELTADERNELQWLVFSHTNYLLNLHT